MRKYVTPPVAKICYLFFSAYKEWQFGSLDITYNPVHSKAALQLSNPKECHKVFLSFWDLGMLNFQESFGVLFINTKNHVVGYRTIAVGGRNTCYVDKRIIFAIALNCGATGIILAHNHPTKDLKPSKEDKILTDSIVQGAIFLDIKVLDHLIISADSYYSFRENGLMK